MGRDPWHTMHWFDVYFCCLKSQYPGYGNWGSLEGGLEVIDDRWDCHQSYLNLIIFLIGSVNLMLSFG